MVGYINAFGARLALQMRLDIGKERQIDEFWLL
jgi:hypothetical protein